MGTGYVMYSGPRGRWIYRLRRGIPAWASAPLASEAICLLAEQERAQQAPLNRPVWHLVAGE